VFVLSSDPANCKDFASAASLKDERNVSMDNCWNAADRETVKRFE